MVRERTSAGLCCCRGRGTHRRAAQEAGRRREIAEAVISGRKTAAQMARMFGLSPPTVRIADLRELPDVNAQVAPIPDLP
jgi:hypothetical protein